ncbi:putative hydrolase of HD superfamily [Keratinibaculum paraultunense]|uniref:Putative hydrolase of HD superfamily n=1 Tax=Keratinibaculum paraultunense TaxID=1278232 RepID=A0A4R3KXC2_9FIRM|nr:HD domain-containing protein [Keratinibaculum paraultunense]QQY78875.1 HD domain-containing protein [Keratinibaculum paraultunense]TCS90487.1 putative hydrolase of HD superfamily [Keratinibaculum paraultunense]
MNNDRLLKDIEFIVELDKMKTILRQTTLIDKSKRENDAEHSWHISVMAMILSEYANEEIDVCKVIKMLLIHDLVEIYAGDTFCYDVEGNKDKKERETKAAYKIFGMLDEDKGRELRKLWEEFEEMKTNEALFAASMDRLQPFLNNYFSDGGTWKKFNVSKKDIYKRIAPLKESSNILWNFTKNMIEDAYDRGYILRE